MKVYLSLPISGQPTKLRMAYANQVRNELTEAFWRREGIFEYESNLKVVTPFDVNENEDKDSYARKMGNDIEALLECDAIYLCEGWQNSKGCMAEFEVARIYGKEIMFEPWGR